MTTYEYSPVGSASSSAGSSHAASKRLWSHMLGVSPFFRIFLGTLLDWTPATINCAFLCLALGWRRVMTWRPLGGLFPHFTVAHVILLTPLLYWSLKATDLALLKPTIRHALKNTGKLTSYVMVFCFVTASKSHSVVSLITGLSFERLVKIHLLSALLALWMACLHGIQIAYYHKGSEEEHHHHHDEDEDEDEEGEEHHHHHDDEDEDDHDHELHYHRILHHHHSIHAYLGPEPNLRLFLVDGGMNQTGFCVLVSLAVVVLTSLFHPVWRKWWFEGWMVSHITGATVMLVAGILHGADAFVFGVIWWALDMTLRYVFLAGIRYPHQAQIKRVAENVTQISWEKTNNFQYEAGQFVQIAIPDVKMWEFHPISIASAPEDSRVTLFVRALPSPKAWTRQLYDLAAPRDEQKASVSSVRVFFEGPYGSIPPILASIHNYSMAVLISGGIGVTPCHSIARALIKYPHQAVLQKLRYVWSVREQDMIEAIPPPTVNDQAQAQKKATTSNKVESFDDENDIELVERGQEEIGNGDVNTLSEDSDIATDIMMSSSCTSLAVQTDIYLTKLEQDKFQDFDENPLHNGEEGDDNPNSSGGNNLPLAYKLHKGVRPDLFAIMEQVQAEAQKEGWAKVLVMGCGPLAMLDELQVACRRSQTKQVQIDYHEEIFDY